MFFCFTSIINNATPRTRILSILISLGVSAVFMLLYFLIHPASNEKDPGLDVNDMIIENSLEHENNQIFNSNFGYEKESEYVITSTIPSEIEDVNATHGKFNIHSSSMMPCFCRF